LDMDSMMEVLLKLDFIQQELRINAKD